MSEILWLTPDKGENISVGRQQIRNRLINRGHSVRQVAAKPIHLLNGKTKPYDVCIGTTRAGGLYGLGSVRNGTPFIVDHVDPIRQFYETDRHLLANIVDFGERHAFKHADGVLYVYPEEIERVHKHNANATKTTLGVDYERFHNPEQRGIEHTEKLLYSKNIEPGFAVYIGGLEPIYNIETMLEAAEVSTQELVVVGSGSKQELVETYDTTNSSVHYLETLHHQLIPGILDKASVGLCLVDDPHTVKVLEYGASGLPVVHLAGRARAELPTDVRFVNNTPGDVAIAMEQAVDDDTDEIVKYAKAHDWEGVVDDYETMIQEVV